MTRRVPGAWGHQGNQHGSDWPQLAEEVEWQLSFLFTPKRVAANLGYQVGSLQRAAARHRRWDLVEALGGKVPELAEVG